MAIGSGSSRGYGIRLANGQGWHIIATEAVRPWVERLASILELKVYDQNGYPTLVFIRRDTGKEKFQEPTCCLKPNMQEDLPGSGWKSSKLSAIKIWSHPDVPDVICEMVGHGQGHELDIMSKWLALYPIFQRALSSGGLPFHAALVEREGMGILLAASGNTGKSTCCRRLPLPWHARCDDETLVVRDDQKRYLAHPLPTWSDYLWRGSEQTWSVERHVSLSAIFFLEQAEIDEVLTTGQGEAAVFMTQSAMQVYQRNWHNLDQEEVRVQKKKLLDNASEFARAVPAFRLRVSLKGRFWEEMERVL
jgi:SynChlorMet cassette protein ScmC